MVIFFFITNQSNNKIHYGLINFWGKISHKMLNREELNINDMQTNMQSEHQTRFSQLNLNILVLNQIKHTSNTHAHASYNNYQNLSKQ